MAKYLLIESRNPHSARTSEQFYQVAADLARAGNEVTMFLVQNGVFPARRSGHSQALTKVADAGVEILADSFSLRERGISGDRLMPGVKQAELDVVVDQLADGRKAMWH